MFRYSVYIESNDFILPLVIYADNERNAGKKGIKLFNKTFKNKERIVSVKVKKDLYYFGWYEC